MIQFKVNAQTDGRTDRWKDGQKDEQTLFYRTLLTTIGGPTTKKSFIQVTNGNSLQISSLWMLLLPHQPNQTHPCWGWARQQSKQKLGPFFGCCVSYKLAKMLFFSSKIHKNQEKHVPFYLQYAFFLLSLEAAFIFYTSVHVSHIKWRAAVPKWISFIYFALD